MSSSSWARSALLFLWSAGIVAGQLDVQTPLGFQGDNITRSCHDACTSLTTTLGEKVFYSTLPSELFTDYFSARQSSTRPLCLILPTSAQDVSDAIKIIGQNECIFAVKSGGHAMFEGASNAQDGITFDLRYLDELELEEGRETVRVGTGNRWGSVYNFLDPWNLTVVGGRDANVGVGGFLLGGGISFLSRRYGWGLDNVRNFEVVLANGSISQVSQSKHPDLYWALRGGGTNFGIVTRFDLETKPLDPMWGGFTGTFLAGLDVNLHASGVPRQFSWTPGWFLDKASDLVSRAACRFRHCVGFDEFAEMMAELAVTGSDDKYAQAYGVIGILPYVHNWGVVFELNHGKGLHEAPAFGKLVNVTNKSLWTTNRLANSTAFAKKIADMNVKGKRQTYQTATFKVDVDLIKEVMKIYMTEFDPIRSTKGLMGSLPFFIITKDEIRHFSKNGGNALGIVEEDGPLLIVETAIAWDNNADDELVIGAAQKTIDRSVALGKELGLHHRYIYQNYAAKHQDVFEGYGSENRKRLREIQKKYDPEGIYSRLNPGYFKV